jgi:hypothetical protein
MKKTMFLIAATLLLHVGTNAQETFIQQMQPIVTKLDNANSVKDYQQLANDFLVIGNAQKTQWLPYYYAAFCNAKIGWLKQNDDPDNIESFANKAEEEIKKAQSLLDTSKEKKELSEIYCVYMMLNQARVFINPQTYGRQYGPIAFNYLQLAKQTNPDNPRMLYLQGWQKFSTPKMWGGDKVQAKQLLSAAKQKLASDPSSGIAPHWGSKEVEEILKQLK